MSKVICDVCGTSYPEASTQCPICGCVRPADSIAVTYNEQDAGGYNYVKGGRFSKSNVRKRANSGSTVSGNQKNNINKRIIGLAIVLLCLVVIVTLLVVFIVRTFDDSKNNDSDQKIPDEIACTGLNLSQLDCTMSKIGDEIILDAIPQPADTSDAIVFECSESSVVNIEPVSDRSYKVICVGPGKADIKVSCGSFTVSCRITSNAELPAKVELMRKEINDATFAGKVFYLYNKDGSNVPAEELTWISEKPKIAIVDQFGTVTALSEGRTTIRVEYKGVTVASCDIICDFTVPDNGEDPEGGDMGTATLVPYSHYGEPLPFEPDSNAYSVTLAVDEWVGLYLCDPNDPTRVVEVVWRHESSDSSNCTIDSDGAGVKAKTNKLCYIVAEYNNTIYRILIR